MKSISSKKLELNKKSRAQVSLELAFAFICIFILIIAVVKLSTWLIGRMVVRQEDYENTRVEAGTPGSLGREVGEDASSRYPKLKFFE
jgi:hypothetical protein